METELITVKAKINAPIGAVWNSWTSPEHIMSWNTASEDWHTTKAENDLRAGGHFLSRMEAKDGSFGFDFKGHYNEVLTHELIRYTLDDGRKVKVTFSAGQNEVLVTVVFEAENTNPIEMQRGGWQAILDNFRKYTERLEN